MDNKLTQYDLHKWRTGNEMDYVVGLINGTVWATGYVPHITLKELLTNYLRSAHRRIIWGTYVPDGDKIIKYVENKLSQIDDD